MIRFSIFDFLRFAPLTINHYLCLTSDVLPYLMQFLLRLIHLKKGFLEGEVYIIGDINRPVGILPRICCRILFAHGLLIDFRKPHPQPLSKREGGRDEIFCKITVLKIGKIDADASIFALTKKKSLSL